MIKSDKKLTKAKKSCIKFGVLSFVNVALGVTGLILSSNTLITLVSVASLAVSGVWGVLSYRAGTLDKNKKRREKVEANKQHKLQYKEAYKKKCEQVKKINNEYNSKTYKQNNPGKTETQRKQESQFQNQQSHTNFGELLQSLFQFYVVWLQSAVQPL